VHCCTVHGWRVHDAPHTVMYTTLYDTQKHTDTNTHKYERYSVSAWTNPHTPAHKNLCCCARARTKPRRTRTRTYVRTRHSGKPTITTHTRLGTQDVTTTVSGECQANATRIGPFQESSSSVGQVRSLWDKCGLCAVCARGLRHRAPPLLCAGHLGHWTPVTLR